MTSEMTRWERSALLSVNSNCRYLHLSPALHSFGRMRQSENIKLNTWSSCWLAACRAGASRPRNPGLMASCHPAQTSSCNKVLLWWKDLNKICGNLRGSLAPSHRVRSPDGGLVEKNSWQHPDAACVHTGCQQGDVKTLNCWYEQYWNVGCSRCFIFDKVWSNSIEGKNREPNREQLTQYLFATIVMKSPGDIF